MQITHVIRGSEWLASMPFTSTSSAPLAGRSRLCPSFRFPQTQRQGQNEQARPRRCHERWSFHFSWDMKDLGYTPEGVLNWIALMGWGVAEDDVMTLDQMVDTIFH